MKIIDENCTKNWIRKANVQVFTLRYHANCFKSVQFVLLFQKRGTKIQKEQCFMIGAHTYALRLRSIPCMIYICKMNPDRLLIAPGELLGT